MLFRRNHKYYHESGKTFVRHYLEEEIKAIAGVLDMNTELDRLQYNVDIAVDRAERVNAEAVLNSFCTTYIVKWRCNYAAKIMGIDVMISKKGLSKLLKRLYSVSYDEELLIDDNREFSMAFALFEKYHFYLKYLNKSVKALVFDSSAASAYRYIANVYCNKLKEIIRETKTYLDAHPLIF